MTVAISAAQETQPLEITYLANEGFLIQSGTEKLLVDAIFGRGLSNYNHVPDAERDLLERAQPPFDNVRVALATHQHGDHFNAASVARFLDASKTSAFVSTRQSVAQLPRRIRAMSDRVHGLTPPEGERRRFEFGAIGIEVFFLHHGRTRQTENLGFLIHIGGKKLLHIGDTEANAADFRIYKLPEEEIDIALLPSWFMLRPKWMKAVREQIRPKQIIVMHLPAYGKNASWYREFGGWDGMLKRIKSNFPGAVIALEPMDSWTF